MDDAIRRCRRRPGSAFGRTTLLAAWAVLAVAVLVPGRVGAPPLHPGGPVFGGWEAGIVLDTSGLLALLLHRALAGAPAVPLGDPFLGESLHHHG